MWYPNWQSSPGTPAEDTIIRGYAPPAPSSRICKHKGRRDSRAMVHRGDEAEPRATHTANCIKMGKKSNRKEIQTTTLTD